MESQQSEVMCQFKRGLSSHKMTSNTKQKPTIHDITMYKCKTMT